MLGYSSSWVFPSELMKMLLGPGVSKKSCAHSHTRTRYINTHRLRKKACVRKIQGPHAFSIISVRSQISTFHKNQPSPIASARMEPSDINITLQLVGLESHKYGLSYAKTNLTFLITPKDIEQLWNRISDVELSHVLDIETRLLYGSLRNKTSNIFFFVWS